MSYLNIVRMFWVGLGVIVCAYVVVEVFRYFATEHVFDQSYWTMRRIVVGVLVGIAVLFNTICVGRGNKYIKVSVIATSICFGIYGVIWLLLGGEGHILWRVGFPGFLIVLCICTLIVQKRYWATPTKL